MCLIVSVLFGGGKSWASVTFSDGTLTINVTDNVSDQDATDLNAIVSSTSNVITKIVFTGNGKVTNDFISKLNNHVSSVTVLDMGGVTIDDLSSSSIPTGLDFTKVTEVTVPKTKEVEETMTFPKNVFSSYEWTTAQSGKGITKLIFPEGYTTIADHAFSNENNGGYGWITALSLPSTLKTIGKFAFSGKEKLTSLTLPEGLDKVDDGAFYEAKALKSITLNKNIRFIGAGAFGLQGSDETFTTLIIPASVRYIGPFAFAERKYQDIYFQGTVTPVCPYGAFKVSQYEAKYGTAFTGQDDKVHYCNGGFNASGSGSALADNVNTGYANRENYVNGGFYMTIIHYPADAEDKNCYTDQTRKYETKFKEDGSFDSQARITVGKESSDNLSYNNVSNYTGKDVLPGYVDTYLGKQYIWPSQSQFIRAYVAAALGLNWDGATKYEPELAEWAINILKEAGYNTDDADMKKNAYIGTRKFALSNPDAQKDKYNPGNIKKDGTWWTICVPFNMTKKQVLDTFGEKTQLCLFNEVTRQIEVNGKNHILIRFNIDPMKYKTFGTDGKKLKYENDSDGTHVAGEWKYDEIAKDVVDELSDDDIVIWAHESYMIKPDDGENSDQDPVTIVNYEPVPGNPLPSVVRAKTVSLTQDAEADYSDCYRFIGNYESGMKMPQYSYYYGMTTSDRTAKFRFYTGTTSTWKANKSLIQASAHDGGIKDFQNFFGGSTESASKVMQTTVFGKDDNNGDTTAIDDVQIQVGDDILTPIFSVDGKMVSLSGDTTGLAKGVYVKAGKKFIVR